MAITRTYIYSSDELTDQKNLAIWLQANAVPDYFDRVEIDETDSDGGYPVRCYAGDLGFINFYKSSSLFKVAITTSNGTTETLGHTSSGHDPEYGYKCKNGLMIKLSDTTAGISIVKDDGGNTCIVAMSQCYVPSGEPSTSTAYKSRRLYAVSPQTGTIMYLMCATPQSGFQRTVLAPLVVSDTVNYTTDAYLMTHTQFTGVGTIDIDGVKYLSNGLWCIRDE